MPTAITIEQPQLLLNVEHTCRALSISETTLRRLPIPFVRTGRGKCCRRLYAVADLQAWIDANRQTA